MMRVAPEPQEGSHDPELTGGENTPMGRPQAFYDGLRAARGDSWADDPFAGLPNADDQWNVKM